MDPDIPQHIVTTQHVNNHQLKGIRIVKWCHSQEIELCLNENGEKCTSKDL